MEKVGVVLSGGGARGAYQIGVWKALKRLHIKYDIVTGTSVGALNGILFVQKQYKKAYKIWNNINYSFIFGELNGKNIKNDNLYKMYASGFISSGGLETSGLQLALNEVFNKNKFFSSKVDFGIVTFNLSKLKHEYFIKKNMNENNVKEYVLASASCYPAFKIKQIDNQKYIDGGYYDNLPINLCVEMGAKKIIAIDTKAIGIKRKNKYKNVEIINICPNNQIVDFLKFDKFSCIETIKFGYNDAMKKFGKYYGKLYTFKKIIIKKKYIKYIKYCKKIEEINSIKLFINEFSLNNFIEIMESIGVLLNINQSNIYSIWKYNKCLKNKYKESKEIEKINEVILKNNTIKKSNIKNNNKILMAIYLKIM